MTAGPGTPESPTRWVGRVTSVLVVLAAWAGGLMLLFGVLRVAPTGLFRWLDVVVGGAGCLLLLLRGRRPTLVAVVLAVLASFVASAGVANLVALYALARRRPLGSAVAVAVLDVAAGIVFWLLYPGNDRLGLTVLVNVALAAAVVGWASMRRAQQALLDSYRERAERAEREQLLRAEQARSAERVRIAREMHDAVAHRISLVALHAGGLVVAPEQSPTDVRATASLIRAAAVQGLEELRSTIGVLRADEPGSLEQPGLDRLDDLVLEARRAGQDATLDLDGAGLDGVAAAVGRDVYRIVQEGLTNARKHAAGAPTTVEVARTGSVVRVRVTNPTTAGSLALPPSGTGLLGLRERAELAGGTLRHRVRVPDGFELVAELPWRVDP